MNEKTLAFLEHHGVKGQKWGVRNNKKGKTPSTDFKKTVSLRRRSAHELSNKQLKTVNERLNLEQNYNRMNPSSIDAGHNMAKKLLSIGGTAAGFYALVKSPAGQAAISGAKTFLRTAKILKVVH